MSEYPALFQPGQRIERYEVQRLLGRSPLTEVYRALDPDLKREVAIKVIHPQIVDAQMEVEKQRQFRQDIQQVAALNHPNILPVFDFGVTRDIYFIVMQIVDGVSLRDRLSAQRRALPSTLAMWIFREVADAVAYAHGRGIVHQDIRPSNILLGEGDHALLTDFGLSRIIAGDPLATPMASTRMPLYMSPEQAAGREITSSTDIYSLGVLLYEMVTGDVPFKGDSVASVLVKHMQEIPRRPSELNVELNLRAEEAILRALDKDEVKRFASPNDMLNALEAPTDSGEYDTLSLPRKDARVFREQVRSEAERHRKLRGYNDETVPPTEQQRSLLLIGLLVGAGLIALVLIILLISGQA